MDRDTHRPLPPHLGLVSPLHCLQIQSVPPLLPLLSPLPTAEAPVLEIPAVPAYISERYKVGRTLGDGNFAVVRECVEHTTGREYALKIINKSKCRGKVRGYKYWNQY